PSSLPPRASRLAKEGGLLSRMCAACCRSVSTLGQKQTYAVQKDMSALPPKADMCGALVHVCFGPIADISTRRSSFTYCPSHWTFLILPPDSDDMKPEGYYVVRSPSNQLWFATRGLDPDPKVADETVRKHKLYAWKDRDNPPTTKFIPVDGRPWVSQQPDNLNYWKYLSDLYQPEPVEARDRIMFAMLRPLGIEPGKPFKPDARQSKILTEAAKVGELMARTNAFDKRIPGATVYPGKHWEYANMVELNQEAPAYTQLDERGSWFYEAIGESAGMQGRILG